MLSSLGWIFTDSLNSFPHQEGDYLGYWCKDIIQGTSPKTVLFLLYSASTVLGLLPVLQMILSPTWLRHPPWGFSTLEVSDIVLISFHSFFFFPLWLIYFYHSIFYFTNPIFCLCYGFSVQGTLQARVLEWGAIAFSNNYLQPRLLYPARISFKYEGEIKRFSDKQKLREFCTTKHKNGV